MPWSVLNNFRSVCRLKNVSSGIAPKHKNWLKRFATSPPTNIGLMLYLSVVTNLMVNVTLNKEQQSTNWIRAITTNNERCKSDLIRWLCNPGLLLVFHSDRYRKRAKMASRNEKKSNSHKKLRERCILLVYCRNDNAKLQFQFSIYIADRLIAKGCTHQIGLELTVESLCNHITYKSPIIF